MALGARYRLEQSCRLGGGSSLGVWGTGCLFQLEQCELVPMWARYLHFMVTTPWEAGSQAGAQKAFPAAPVHPQAKASFGLVESR